MYCCAFPPDPPPKWMRRSSFKKPGRWLAAGMKAKDPAEVKSISGVRRGSDRLPGSEDRKGAGGGGGPDGELEPAQRTIKSGGAEVHDGGEAAVADRSGSIGEGTRHRIAGDIEKGEADVIKAIGGV